jgi:hypothetical protein
VTGISMLLEKTTSALSILLPLVNLPFIVLGWKHLGRGFADPKHACDRRARGCARDDSTIPMSLRISC